MHPPHYNVQRARVAAIHGGQHNRTLLPSCPRRRRNPQLGRRPCRHCCCRSLRRKQGPSYHLRVQRTVGRMDPDPPCASVIAACNGVRCFSDLRHTQAQKDLGAGIAAVLRTFTAPAALVLASSVETSIVGIAYALNAVPAVVAHLAEHEPNKEAILAFYNCYETHLLGVMHRLPGKKRSKINIPCTHPGEYVAKFLSLVHGSTIMHPS